VRINAGLLCKHVCKVVEKVYISSYGNIHYFSVGFSCEEKGPVVSVLVGARHIFTTGLYLTCSRYWSRAPHLTVMPIYVHWHVGVVCRKGRLSYSPVTVVTAMNLLGPIHHSYLTGRVMQLDLDYIYISLRFAFRFRKTFQR
jgi:hypothetical protein